MHVNHFGPFALRQTSWTIVATQSVGVMRLSRFPRAPPKVDREQNPNKFKMNRIYERYISEDVPKWIKELHLFMFFKVGRLLQ